MTDLDELEKNLEQQTAVVVSRAGLQRLIARCRKAEARVAELEAQSGEAGGYSEQSAREGFERYASIRGMSLERTSDSYKTQATKSAWRAWNYLHKLYLRAPQAVPEWQPIETAPKDGTEVLIYLGAPWRKVEKARWYEPWKNWQAGAIPADPVREECYGIGSAVPTHWMPLPAAPSPEGE